MLYKGFVAKAVEFVGKVKNFEVRRLFYSNFG